MDTEALFNTLAMETELFLVAVYIRPNNLLIGKKVASYWAEGLLNSYFDKQLCT